MEDWVKLVLTGDPRIVAGLVTGGLAGLGTGITAGKIFGNWTLNRRLAEAEKQLKALKSSLDDSVYLWLRKPLRADDYVQVIKRSIPIIMIVNLKGGVGKPQSPQTLSATSANRRDETVRRSRSWSSTSTIRGH